jgi:hypothetical protein
VREKFLLAVKKESILAHTWLPPPSNLNEKFFNEIVPSFSITSLSVIVTFLITAGCAVGRRETEGKKKMER